MKKTRINNKDGNRKQRDRKTTSEKTRLRWKNSVAKDEEQWNLNHNEGKQQKTKLG